MRDSRGREIQIQADSFRENCKVSGYDRRRLQKSGMEQQLIVTYFLKYRNYLRSIRDRQVKRALKTVEAGAKAVERKRQNDPKRFIKADHATADGEEAGQTVYYIDEEAVAQEEKYDGFYAVCTSLEDGPEDIIKVNRRRWEVEECFRIMKSEFQARPVYLKRQERIVAHFITCFIALILYRYLEKKLDKNIPVARSISTLQEMNFIKYEGKGYRPAYTCTELTDALHEAFGFCTSKQIVPIKKMKKIVLTQKAGCVTCSAEIQKSLTSQNKAYEAFFSLF